MTKLANRPTLMRFGDSAENTEPTEVSGRNQEIVRQFIWDVASINVHLEEIRYFWAKVLGITGPQWMILMALVDLDRGQGVAVKVVSKILHVDPSFVTTQSKILEKKGFIRRKTSGDDARVVRMSLTDKAYKQLENLSSQREALDRFIFAEFTDRELKIFTEKFRSLKSRCEKARLMVAMDNESPEDDVIGIV